MRRGRTRPRSRGRAPRRGRRTGTGSSPARTPPRTRGTRRRATPSNTVGAMRNASSSRARRRRSPRRPRCGPARSRAMISSNCVSLTIGPTSVSGSSGSPTCRASMRASSASRKASYTLVLDEDAARRGALLAGRPERACVRRLGGPAEVGVGHHDQRVVPAELELHALAVRASPRRARRGRSRPSR